MGKFSVKAPIGALFFLCVFFETAHAQFANTHVAEEAPINWQLMDLKADGVFGISMEKAYTELLKGKKSKPVIVAVIDGGVDVNHEDLKSVIWTNPKEIPGNGKDDDGNGFADDVHGWNFFSSMGKGDEEFDLRELTKQIKKNPAFKQQLDERLSPARQRLKTVQDDLAALDQILSRMNKPNPGVDDFKNYIPQNAGQLKVQLNIVAGLKVFPTYVTYRMANLERAINHYKMELAYYENQDYDLITGGPTTHHGTHIAGIIAADRNNNIGIKGVADNVKIMSVRAIGGINPSGEIEGSGEMKMSLAEIGGDETDIKVAKSIHYAVDNGARVINMSFHRSNQEKSVVLDEAIKYAIDKNVLMIHAAGNLGQDTDLKGSYPDRKTPEGRQLLAGWIDVGASGWKNDGSLAQYFSNYGQTTVDVFAPGLDIYSTAPRGRYIDDLGTSMATPVVAGLAAVIMEYYPKLTAKQIKEIIMKSVVKADALKDKCVSGGVVNAFEAIRLAAAYE